MSGRAPSKTSSDKKKRKSTSSKKSKKAAVSTEPTVTEGGSGGSAETKKAKKKSKKSGSDKKAAKRRRVAEEEEKAAAAPPEPENQEEDADMNDEGDESVGSEIEEASEDGAGSGAAAPAAGSGAGSGAGSTDSSAKKQSDGSIQRLARAYGVNLRISKDCYAMANKMLNEFIEQTTEDACARAEVPKRVTIQADDVYTMGAAEAASGERFFNQSSIQAAMNNIMAKVGAQANIMKLRRSQEAFDKLYYSAQFYVGCLFKWASDISGASNMKTVMPGHLEVALNIANKSRDLL